MNSSSSSPGPLDREISLNRRSFRCCASLTCISSPGLYGTRAAAYVTSRFARRSEKPSAFSNLNSATRARSTDIMVFRFMLRPRSRIASPRSESVQMAACDLGTPFSMAFRRPSKTTCFKSAARSRSAAAGCTGLADSNFVNRSKRWSTARTILGVSELSVGMLEGPSQTADLVPDTSWNRRSRRIPASGIMPDRRSV